MSDNEEKKAQNAADPVAETSLAEIDAQATAGKDTATNTENVVKTAPASSPAEDEEPSQVEVVPEAEVKSKEEENALMTTEPQEARKLRPDILPHAFVVMPFGIKKGFATCFFSARDSGISRIWWCWHSF